MNESYWTYQASENTPTLAEAIAAGAIVENTTEREWHQLSPGMRREILRGAKRKERRIRRAPFDQAPLYVGPERRTDVARLIGKRSAQAIVER